MRTSSTHRRLAAALSASTLALVFSLGSPAFGGERSQAGGHGGPDKTATPSVSGSTDDDSLDPQPADDSDNLHPSGKDRHEDNGTQGYSTSTPDQNGSGPERDYQGTDKPFQPTAADGPGGADKQDQDGNNGCGNDDDFEDDNEGLCLGPDHKSTTPPPPVEVIGTTTEKCPEGMTMVEGGTAPKDCKTPEIVTKSSSPVVVTEIAPGAVLASDLEAAPVDNTRVLGIQLEREVPAAVAAGGAVAPAGASVLGAALARTGLSSTLLLLAIAFGLLAVGFALKRAGRTTSDL